MVKSMALEKKWRHARSYYGAHGDKKLLDRTYIKKNVTSYSNYQD